MSHTCQALVIHCIDFRLQQGIFDYLAKNNLLGDCDIVSLAGGAKDFANSDPAAMNQAEISKRLHDIKQIVLMNHTDCGAYGGREAFASPEAEQEKLVSDLREAQKILQMSVSNTKIDLLLIKIEQNHQKLTFVEIS